ncbi:MAG: hypothetical protein AVDCRST_MAG42-2060 [uncultured Chthoniobacterales bacterium]|uniref:Uncharacterized protein n=1 Tax=uncultured Chthoniobacterales bacterium TaxID=1836801 RepID=A0A6J4IBS3_9BACT|nr:MAG: hypothetical protein AVDCRST_MAG42-2060 [uncultured Chthoniobacterales bacterium]
MPAGQVKVRRQTLEAAFFIEGGSSDFLISVQETCAISPIVGSTCKHGGHASVLLPDMLRATFPLTLPVFVRHI